MQSTETCAISHEGPLPPVQFHPFPFLSCTLVGHLRTPRLSLPWFSSWTPSRTMSSLHLFMLQFRYISDFCNNFRLLGLNNSKAHGIPRIRHSALISVLCVDTVHRYFNFFMLEYHCVSLELRCQMGQFSVPPG
jgi:hypothetical protein